MVGVARASQFGLSEAGRPKQGGICIITYAPLLTMVVIASILFSVIVFTNHTLFPAWMAAINPLTMTIAWLLLKRILPAIITDALEGAGFNIAYFIFFVCTTITLWSA